MISHETADGGRAHDIVLFGATGFTGRLTAEYLARHAPPGTRWALAGRDRRRLTEVRATLAAIDPDLADQPLIVADATDPADMRALASSTRVVATTVGPYLRHGSELVAACAAAGTDYLDLTGEPEFVDRTYLRHHRAARESGARLVHCCGFESVPYDLGVWHTVRRLPREVPLRVEGFVRVSGAISAGTYHSALGVLSRLRPAAALARERRRAEPRESGRRVRGIPTRPRFDRRLNVWTLPLPTIDPRIVLRSARELEEYGPSFGYGHHLATRRLPAALGVAAGAVGLAALAQFPSARGWLEDRMASGEGPTEAERASSWFKVLFLGEGGGRRVVTEVSGGDPGYEETSTMLAESALCLAFDELPESRGQVTPAVAMAEALTGRLRAAGLTIASREL